ncbi:MAG: tryptophan 7-halogenase, partial [Acidobacteriota bacterium]|nr:tryptophan 7-halogenase [Acidobacteriota bacterium]
GELVQIENPPAREKARERADMEPFAGRTVAIVGGGHAARRFALRLKRAGYPALRLLEIQSIELPDTFAEADRRVHIPAPRRRPGGAGARRPAWAERVAAISTADLAAQLQGVALAVCILEGMPYRALFAVQAACLAASVTSLFQTVDPDGLRLGPVSVPGITPCLVCAQLAAFRALGLAPAPLLDAIGHFRTGRSGSSPTLDRAETAMEEEIHRLLSADGEPALLSEILWLTPEGAVRRLPVERVPACPLCGGMEAPAEDDEHGILRRTSLLAAERLDRSLPRAFPAEPGDLVGSVGILGGGTAGYLAALALRRKLPHLDVTLIESSDVPIIGVGEATTPLMPQFLHVDLGLDVHQLFREVRPTFKLGIRFLWGAQGDGDFNYPFGPVHVLEPVVYGGDLRDCSLQSMLMTAGALPLYDGDGRLGTAVAYHLDNERFVGWLQRRAAELGVRRIDANILTVERSADGEEVRALVAGDGRRFSFDLYVDCSGFRSLLLEKTLGSPWLGFDGSLFADRAVVAPVPHGGRVRPYTTAETMSAGWCWSTPQEDADHRGYVFASAFQTPEEAEAEMRAGNPGMGPARLVRFRAGRHEHFSKGNVVALGNAYGFVEPLESTALHMLIRQIGLLVRNFPLRLRERGFQALQNRKVGAWWDYLRWFLAIHYRFNRRVDSPFWRTCREEVDVSSYAELLAAFRERGPLSYDPAARTAFDYPDPLWGPEGIDVLLLGQKVAARLPRPALPPAAWNGRLRLARSVVARAEPHERALGLLTERPDLLDRMVAAFRAAGPAFPVG